MRDNRGKNRPQNGRGPSFSVQDEIRRDRRMRRTSHVRRARSATQTVLTAVLCLAICALLIIAVVCIVTRAASVTVSGNGRYSAAEILEAADVDGDILPLLREQTVYKRVAAACPYVESIELVKVYPSSVEIIVHETEPVYVTITHGRQLTLDRELRVMDFTETADGLIRLVLPEFKNAVEGSRVVFTDAESESFVVQMLDAFFTEDLLGLTSLDLTDRYALTATVGDGVKILFGDYRNIDVKLSLAKKIMADAEAAYSARTLIDVSEPSRASAQYDYNGEF
ncbi:MAG: FtsQ-type POTRA domain-containing protein [Clostridia bacterium]|nr:FtsQ-type POTRA domain-containing protein [Clostridia bacterium]